MKIITIQPSLENEWFIDVVIEYEDGTRERLTYDMNRGEASVLVNMLNTRYLLD
jgi:hypothetical protein